VHATSAAAVFGDQASTQHCAAAIFRQGGVKVGHG